MTPLEVSAGDTGTLWGVIGFVVVSTVGGIRWWVSRQPPPYHPREQMADLEKKIENVKADAATNLTQVEARHDKEIGALKDEVGEERSARRGLEDYVEQLRKHISDGNPPPPPPWPEGLRR